MIVAVEDTKLIAISKELLEDRINEADDFVHILVRLLLTRVMFFNDCLFRLDESIFRGITDRYPWYSSVIDNKAFLAKVKQKLTLESALQKVIDHKGFENDYQPIVNIETKEIEGVESLFRWKAIAELDVNINTEQIITVAEETSMIIPLSWIAIERSFQDLAPLIPLVTESFLSQ